MRPTNTATVTRLTKFERIIWEMKAIGESYVAARDSRAFYRLKRHHDGTLAVELIRDVGDMVEKREPAGWHQPERRQGEGPDEWWERSARAFLEEVVAEAVPPTERRS